MLFYLQLYDPYVKNTKNNFHYGSRLWNQLPVNERLLNNYMTTLKGLKKEGF